MRKWHGYNFFNNNTDLTPSLYHGTHCSGIIAAVAGNGVGIAGTASAAGANVKIMMLSTGSAGKEYEDQNTFKELGAFNYILKARQRGVNIVATSNSWGNTGSISTVYDEIINKLGEEGIISFIAAGNHWTDLDNNGSDAPATGDSPYLITVGAADITGRPASFTNYGKSSVHVFAPGVNVLSTVSYPCYFPNIYSPDRRNDTTEYYGLFDGGTVIGTDSKGNSCVTPSKGDTNEEMKSFGGSVFHAQPQQNSAYEPEGTATYELSVSKDRSFTAADDPGSLKLTIHDAEPGEEYFFYFPYEKNPSTTGDNTHFSIYAMNSIEEGGIGYMLSGGEVLVDADGSCELYNGGNGPRDAISSRHVSSDSHMCVMETFVPLVISADDLEASDRSVGIGIRLRPVPLGTDGPGDISIYLDSVAVSRPEPEIPEGSRITPETSYNIDSGTSMATPACVGAYAAYAACHPRKDGETGSEYALRGRSGFLSLVTRTDALRDLCSTGGYIDLTHMGEEERNPVIDDAVCDLTNDTLTIHGAHMNEGFTLRYKKLEDKSAEEVTLPAGNMDVRFSEDGKTAVITNARALFGTYIEFLLCDSSSVRASNSFFLVKGQKQLEEVYREELTSGAGDQTDPMPIRKLFTDTKGQALYACEPKTGVVYKYDGKQFNKLAGTGLEQAAREYMMKEKGLDQYESTHDLEVWPMKLSDVIYTDNKLYQFVEITHAQGSETLENGEEQFCLLASLDYTADRPAWSFTEIGDPDDGIQLNVIALRFAALNGKIYCVCPGEAVGADKPRNSLVYSYDIASGEWSGETDLNASPEMQVVAVKDNKLYMLLGTDYADGSGKKLMSRKAYCFDGSEWTTLNDIPFSGKYEGLDQDEPGNVLSTARAVCAPVKNGFIFFNCAADGFGNTFLYDPDTGKGEPLYYTFSDFKADNPRDASAVETKDGVYYLYQYTQYTTDSLVMYCLPRSSGEYESSYEEEPAPPAAPEPGLNFSSARLKAGDTLVLKVTGGTVKKWASSDSKVASVSKGLVKALTKGSATLTATLDTGETLSCTVKVATSPELGDKTITLKKGASRLVAIVGRAPGTDNDYRSTDVAEIVSDKAVSSIKVHALKAGSTTLKVRVNGVWLSLEVVVK